jgi:tRNA(fMet)-specific endonuclease VapC
VVTYLLDTNICIYIIKRKPFNVFERFQSLTPGTVGISSITAAELQYGVSKSAFPEKNQSALQQFLVPLEIIEFDYEAATYYGKIRSHLEKNGTPIGPLDMLIGAHAQSLNVILITNNLKEFTRIENLKTENWII